MKNSISRQFIGDNTDMKYRFRFVRRGLLLACLALLPGPYTSALAGQPSCAVDEKSCGWTQLLSAEAFGKTPAIRDIAADAAGHTILVGDTYPATEQAGKSVGLMVKYDFSGNVIWTKHLAASNSSFTTANSIDMDAGGDFCLGGATDGVFGKQKHSLGGGFVASYRADGSQLWTKNTSEAILKVAVDDKGNCLATSLNEVIKFTERGGVAWRRPIAGGTLAVGPDGAVYVTTPVGDGTVPVIAVMNAAGKEISRLLPPLAESWGAKEFDLRNRMLAVDRQGKLHLQATLTFVADGGGQTVGAYLTALDVTGKPIWERYHTTAGFRWDSFDLSLDAAGNVFLAGRRTSMTNPSQIDAFVLGFDTGGKLLWESPFGTPDFDGAGSIAIDGQGNYYVAGGTEGSLDGQANSVKQWAVPFVKQSRTGVQAR